jgi:uncharacterized protein involved in exopolysaccharide biosynthesis
VDAIPVSAPVAHPVLNDPFKGLLMAIEQTPSPPFASRLSSLTARDLLAVGFRQQKIIVLAFLGIFLTVALIGLSRPKMYEAGVKILVKRERAESILTPEETAAYRVSQGVTEQEINSEIELLWSRDLHENAVIANRLHERQNISLWTSVKSLFKGAASDATGERAKIAAAVLSFGDWFQVQPYKKSNLIRVSYSSPDPQLAVQVINSVTELYLAKHLDVHRSAAAFGFFEHETARYRKELEVLHGQIADHAGAEGVVAAQSEKETTLKQLTDLEGTLQRTRIEIAEAQERIRALEARRAVIPERVTTQVREASALLLEKHRSTLLTLELKHAELSQLFHASYPPVKDIANQIELTRKAIRESEAAPITEKITDRDSTHQWLTSELARVRSELPALQARATAIARSIEANRVKARRLDRVQFVQDNLLREARLAEQNFLIYSRKREEARISDQLDSQRIVNVAVAEPPSVPYRPTGPSRKLILLLAVILASVGSVVVAFAVDYFDPSFRTPEEVQGYLGVPVLAALPRN